MNVKDELPPLSIKAQILLPYINREYESKGRAVQDRC